LRFSPEIPPKTIRRLSASTEAKCFRFRASKRCFTPNPRLFSLNSAVSARFAGTIPRLCGLREYRPVARSRFRPAVGRRMGIWELLGERYYPSLINMGISPFRASREKLPAHEKITGAASHLPACRVANVEPINRELHCELWQVKCYGGKNPFLKMAIDCLCRRNGPEQSSGSCE
jgi:hypothetical protein